MGSSQNIQCTVSTVSGVESSLVMISWRGPGGNIDATNGRVSIGSVTDDGNNVYTRSLQFTYLMEGDEGNYTCNVMILETSASQSVELQSLNSKLFILIVDFIFVRVASDGNATNCHVLLLVINNPTKNLWCKKKLWPRI